MVDARELYQARYNGGGGLLRAGTYGGLYYSYFPRQVIIAGDHSK